MKNNQIIIGIDPDTVKSGVATLIPQETRIPVIETLSLSFGELISYLQNSYKASIKSGFKMIVVVEAGYLNRSNWHTNKNQNYKIAARIGSKTGANHQTAKHIIEMCKDLEIEVIEQIPLKKCWAGKDGKITHLEVKKFTGIEGRTNQEERDALLLAWNYANLPIRISPITDVKR